MAITITRTAWTDDDGTGTVGSVIDNAVKTELYGQIDAALALLLPLAGGTLTGGLIGTTAAFSGAVTLGDIATQSIIGAGANGVGIGATHASGTIRWYSGGTTEYMRLHTNGFLALGDTPGTADMPFHLVKSVVSFISRFTNPNANPAGLSLYYSGAAPNGTGNPFVKAEDTGGTRAEIRSNGGLANYSANNVNLSDDSAKDYDAPLSEADIAGDVAAFLNLEIRRGKYKDATEAGKSLMFSAQQVKRTKSEWSAIFDEKKGLLGTKEHAILMAAYATIRNLDKRVTALEAA